MSAKLRLFFAAWPQEDTAQKLERWAREVGRQSGGRVTRAATIHLTLAFLGDVATDRVRAAVEAAGRVRAPAHRLPIEEARYWPHNRIVWVGPKETPPALAELAGSLKRELEAEGFQLEARPFSAHVTLIRQARDPKSLPPLPAVEWAVEEFVLVRSALSSDGSRYAVLARHSLDL